MRIPPGVEDGTALRIAGHGLPAEKPGAPPGDLFVVIRAAEDSRFERRGSDLYRTETIDVVERGEAKTIASAYILRGKGPSVERD